LRLNLAAGGGKPDASYVTGRREAVVFHGLKRTGEAVDCMNVFTKHNGRVCFGEDQIKEGEVPNILTPFLKVWNIRRKSP
jgi:hypothetical protein